MKWKVVKPQITTLFGRCYCADLREIWKQYLYGWASKDRVGLCSGDRTDWISGSVNCLGRRECCWRWLPGFCLRKENKEVLCSFYSVGNLVLAEACWQEASASLGLLSGGRWVIQLGQSLMLNGQSFIRGRSYCPQNKEPGRRPPFPLSTLIGRDSRLQPIFM